MIAGHGVTLLHTRATVAARVGNDLHFDEWESLAALERQPGAQPIGYNQRRAGKESQCYTVL